MLTSSKSFDKIITYLLHNEPMTCFFQHKLNLKSEGVVKAKVLKNQLVEKIKLETI